MSTKLLASVPHIEATIAELRDDPEFETEYLAAAIEELGHPKHRAVGLGDWLRCRSIRRLL